jgi:hypothetical protein
MTPKHSSWQFSHPSVENINRSNQIRASAKVLASRTGNAYSYDRYRSWNAVAEALLRRGYSEREAEAIMRSKWLRWAADDIGARYGHASAKALMRYLSTRLTDKEVAELVDGTFSGIHAED